MPKKNKAAKNKKLKTAPLEDSELLTVTFCPAGDRRVVSMNFDMGMIASVRAASGDKSLILRSSGEDGVLEVECH